MMDNESENPLIDRLKQFLASTGLTSTQFADKAGIPRPTLSQLLHGRNKSINNQILAKLDEAFPELNALWLLFGRGNMLVDSNIEISERQNSSETQSYSSQNLEFQTNLTDATVANNDLGQTQTATISSILGQKMRKQVEHDNSASEPGTWAASVICTSPDDNKDVRPSKRVTSIIVLYSDNSFETFNPA